MCASSIRHVGFVVVGNGYGTRQLITLHRVVVTDIHRSCWVVVIVAWLVDRGECVVFAETQQC